MGLLYSGLTDVGNKRSENQDRIFLPAEVSEEKSLFVLADGMGGVQGGAVASQTVMDTFPNDVTARLADGGDANKVLLSAVTKASRAIAAKSEGKPDWRGMGTTLVALLVRGDQAKIANVGDSRCYLFRNGRLKQITQDHSLIQEQVRAGVLTPEQAKRHKLRNVLTKALGAMPDVEADIYTEKLAPGDLLMMCSDGLYGPVPEEELTEILERGLTVAECAKVLIGRAKKHGAPDNVSVILVQITAQGGDDVKANEKTQEVNAPGAEDTNQQQAGSRFGWRKLVLAALTIAIWSIIIWRFFSK